MKDAPPKRKKTMAKFSNIGPWDTEQFESGSIKKIDFGERMIPHYIMNNYLLGLVSDLRKLNISNDAVTSIIDVETSYQGNVKNVIENAIKTMCWLLLRW